MSEPTGDTVVTDLLPEAPTALAVWLTATDQSCVGYASHTYGTN